MKRVPITVVFHLEMEFPDEYADEDHVRFCVEENHCLDNHIDTLAACRDGEPDACFGCEIGAAFVGHLPLESLRTIVRAQESGSDLGAAHVAMACARAAGTRIEAEPYLCCGCRKPVADFRWSDGPLGSGIETVRGDGTVCCVVATMGEYASAEAAVAHLNVLRHHARAERVRLAAGGGS